MSSKQQLTQQIKQKAIDLGFSGIALAKAEFMDEEATKLENWLNQNYQGEMAYMENHFDLRTDPTRLVPGAKTVISLMYNYFTPLGQEDAAAPKISMYALGKDYHKVVRKKLKTLLNEIRLLAGDVQGRVFVDSAPILERDWAKRSGLGWIGKNTLLITPARGSWFFLGEIIIDMELTFDLPIKDHCGTCRRCIEACPTQAISPEGYIMDGSKCISYLTIELKNEIPTDFEGKMENWVFGCDICQQVCPWNRFSQAHNESEFNPHPMVLALDKKGWEDLSSSQFEEWFGHTPVKRTGYEGIRRNLRFLRRSQDD